MTEQVEQRKREVAQREEFSHVWLAGSECVIAALGDIVVSLPLPAGRKAAMAKTEESTAEHVHQTADDDSIWALALTPFN